MKKAASIIFGFVLLAAISWGGYWVVSQIWGQFKLLDPKVSVAILTASTTVIFERFNVLFGYL